MTTCPCCGQPVAKEDLILSLETNSATRWGRTEKLTPRYAELLHILWSARPKAVPMDRVISRLYGLAEIGDAERAIRVLVSQTRERFARLGLRVEYHRRRGYILSLSDEPVDAQVWHRWTDDELAILKSGKPFKEIRAALPGRSAPAVRIRASKEGIRFDTKRRRGSRWDRRWRRSRGPSSACRE
jgi:DNA-binding winged helix-turn-helix (wHTH) protein